MDPASPGPPTLSPELLLSAIVDSSDDAIVSKDLTGVVTSWNKGAERIFGYAPHEIVGKSITIIIPPDRQDDEPAILQKLQRGERVEHFETQRITKDGRIIDVSLSISPVRDRTGVVIGASKIARDVTEQKRVAARAASAAAEAERQSRIKDEFLATLSHELRTPLQAILGWTQLLLSGDCEEAEQREAIDVIDRNARAQKRIIEDLLDMNRILSGKVRLDVQRVALLPLIELAIETVKPAALAKNIRLQTVLDPLAQPVSGDPNRIQQIFWNLLSNAIKFTPSGGRVQVVLERVNSHLEITVADSGMGIDPDFLPHVFERFRQADSSTTRTHGGLGLGLAIVRHLVELHGGTVRAKSVGANRGSSFIVSFPLAILHAEADPARQHPKAPAFNEPLPPEPRLDGISILVVDDEPDSRELLRAILAKAGADVRTAGSAADALAVWHQRRPDVLVSDIGMPEEDGYSLIAKIRALPEPADRLVPAVALTAYSRTEDRIKAIAAGFQMHLSKPADRVELITMVASLAGKP